MVVTSKTKAKIEEIQPVDDCQTPKNRVLFWRTSAKMKSATGPLKMSKSVRKSKAHDQRIWAKNKQKETTAVHDMFLLSELMKAWYDIKKFPCTNFYPGVQLGYDITPP